jgi:hypothetical protein
MTRPKLTPEERRERVRLRSERWRRTHANGPYPGNVGSGEWISESKLL